MKSFTARALLIVFVLVALPLARTEQAAAEPPVLGRLVDSGEPRPARHGPKHRKPFLHPRGADSLARAKAKAAIAAPTVPTSPGSALLSSPALTGFDGVDESSQLVEPPDGAIAVSPRYIVEAVNDAARIWVKSYDSTGNLSALTVAVSAGDLNAFFGNHPNCHTAANDFFGLVSDPSTDYDAVNHHFMLAMISFDQLFITSSLCVAVSQTEDPTGLWNIYAFPISPGLGSLLDFPRGVLGSDGQLYVSGNLFLCCDASGELFFDHARVYAFRTSDFYSGIGTAPQVVVVGNDPETGLPADSLTPARAVGVGGMYFVSASNPSTPASSITLWKWSDPFGGNVFTRQGHVTVSTYTQPPNAPQPGAFPSGVTSCAQTGAHCITTNDARNLAAYWFGDTVYGTHAVGCSQGGASVPCVQWYQLGSLDGPPALLQQGIVDDQTDPVRYRYFPSLAVDQNGNVALAYAYSSTGEYPGIAYTALSSSGPLGSETVLKAGEATLISTRYGDYAGTALDPYDDLTIWHVEEYAKLLSGAGEWGTWISAIQIAGATSEPDFSISAAPASPPAVLPGATQTYTVTVNALNGFSGTVNLAVSGLPAGATGSFSPASVSVGATPATATLTVTTTSATTGGNYTLTITGTAGSIVHASTVTLAVKDFALSVSPSSRTVRHGKSTSYTVSVRALNGFTGTVTLGPVGGLPDGATASFSTSAVTFASGGATSANTTLKVTTLRSTPRGTYTLSIAASGAGVTRTVSAPLTVQ
jgi:hypothetical protein